MKTQTRNKILKYFIYTMWIDLLNTVFLTWWLFLLIHYTMDQYITWLWQGFLYNLVIAYPMARAILWMEEKSDKALGINKRDKKWILKEYTRMHRGIRTIDERLAEIYQELKEPHLGTKFGRLNRSINSLETERIKCGAKIQLLRKMLN